MGIYVIEAGCGLAFKVGFTDGDPLVRLASLQTGNHERLSLVDFYPHWGRFTEAAAHHMLRDAACSGEWFKASRRDVLAAVVASTNEAGLIDSISADAMEATKETWLPGLRWYDTGKRIGWHINLSPGMSAPITDRPGPPKSISKTRKTAADALAVYRAYVVDGVILHGTGKRGFTDEDRARGVAAAKTADARDKRKRTIDARRGEGVPVSGVPGVWWHSGKEAWIVEMASRRGQYRELGDALEARSMWLRGEGVTGKIVRDVPCGMVNIDDAARLVQKDPATVRRWVADGKLVGERLNGKLHVFAADAEYVADASPIQKRYKRKAQ